MVGTRRKARRVALQTLHEVDSVGHDPEITLDRLLEEMTLDEEGASFARELVKGVFQNQKRIDETIRRFAPTWPLEQMPYIDRNILRLAIFEIVLNNKVPVKAAINEAVELAKTFGSDSSPKFVNGVLGSVSDQHNR
ncbi:transcription antitermination factor NusB [Chloroflexota bacterium]